jgi:hypothetical protein
LDTTQTPNDFFNTAPLLNATGTVIFTHQKLRRYGKYDIAEDSFIPATGGIVEFPLARQQPPQPSNTPRAGRKSRAKLIRIK